MNIDHCVIAVPDLESGIDWFEHSAGVRPMSGGRHDGLGTQNALVSLGHARYLELIAIDPGQAVQTPMTELLHGIERPTGLGWCLGTADAQATAARLEAAGFDAVSVPSSRKSPDGPSLSWVTVIATQPFSGAVPFYIDWLDSPHPSDSAPLGCELVDLTPAHPDVPGLRETLRRMEVDVPVTQADRPGAVIRLRTPNGDLEVGP